MSIQTQVEVTTITPAVATALLATNPNNRDISPSRVKEIAADITAGEFVMNGDTVRISSSGVLLDGQHRLSACVAANKSIVVIVASGLADEVFSHIDNGKIRAAGDTLKVAGFKNPKVVAAGVRAAATYGSGSSQTTRLQNRHLLEMAKGEFSNMTVFADTVGSWKGITKNSRVVAAAYIISKAAPASIVIEFFSRVCRGEGLQKGMPEYALREWLYSAKTAGFSTRHTNRRDTISACITAWNKFAEGKQLRIIRIQSSKVEPKACK